MSDEMVAKVGAVVIDTEDVDRLVEFWGALLGIEERHRVGSYFVWMSRMGEGGPSLAFQKVPEAKSGKNRLHLDLGVEDREAFAARVEELGGSKVEDHSMDRFTWSVMSDPEGNEFCISDS